MDEVLPGIFHWSAKHPQTGGVAHSYLLAESATVLDPMVPPEALELLRERPPERVVLTNRHHYREAGKLVEEFGVPVLCPQPGLHEFEGDDREVEGYAFGTQLASGLKAHEVGSICPDDGAIEVRTGPGALAFADGLMRRKGELGFVSDGLIADDPADVEPVKRGLVASLERLSELEFDALLFAHGEPLADGGRDALARFVGEMRAELG